MVSVYGLIAFGLLLFVAYFAWLNSKRTNNKILSLPVQNNEQSKLIEAPDPQEWCNAIANLMNCEPICLDDALCIVAVGLTSRKEESKIEDSKKMSGMHFVDVIPSDSASELIEIAASVRRGSTVVRKILWNNSQIKIFGAPIGKKWIVLCKEVMR